MEGPDGPLGGVASQRQALALLALVAGAGPRGLSRDKLVALLWAEAPGAKATHRLTQLIYSLRRDLSADPFLGSAELRLNPGVIRTDLQEFMGPLESGDLAGAVRGYAGPFLDGFFLNNAPEFEHWVDGERERLAERFRTALDTLADGAFGRGDLPAAAGWWRQLSQADPMNAAAAVHYLECLDRLGDRAGALRFVRAHEARLRAEYDSEPEPSVTAVAERIRQAAPLRPQGLPAPALAVLPFNNLTPDRENEYFSDGMAEELTGALTRVPGLRVASQLSARRFKGQEGDPRAIAEQLGVSALVSGSVRKVGNRIRLTAQLVNGGDGSQLWSETYDRTLDDVFVLQEELARAIVAALPLATATDMTAMRPPTAVPDAYTLYLRGRYSAHKRTPEGLSLGVEYFEQAVERDPRYALAHAGLAECVLLLAAPEFGDAPPLEVMPRAKAAALEALRLDPRLSEAHNWLGVTRFLFDWDWPAAEDELRRATQLRPDNAYAHCWYGVFQGAMGRHGEAIRRMLYALALEPAAPQIRLCVPRCHYWARRFPEALESLEDLLRVQPGDPLVTTWLGRVLCATGRYEEALARLEQVPPDRRTHWVDGVLATAFAGSGRVEEARAHLSPRFSSLWCYALLGEHETALDLLESRIRARDGYVVFAGVDSAFDLLRDCPRFETIMAQVALPGSQQQAERS